MTITFIDEATVTRDGMWAGRHIECTSERRGFRRVVVWERTFAWDRELHLAEASPLAVTILGRLGLRLASAGWWWDLDPEMPIPHLYAVLERIPGSTRGWRD